MKKRVFLLLSDFIHSGPAGGILLMVATALAMVLANSPLSTYYDLIIDRIFILAIW